jgi:acyl-coenzyme A thioesterase PaaI-like protein
MGPDPQESGRGHLYDWVGIESELLDANSVETTLPADDALLGAGAGAGAAGGRGRAAYFGLAMEHGMPLLADVAAVPVVIAVHLRQPAAAPGRQRVVSRIVRLGRTMMVTGGTFYGSGGTMTGFGTVTWSVSGTLPSDQPPRTPLCPGRRAGSGSGFPETIGLRPAEEGSGYQIGEIVPAIAGPGGILHAGAVQLLCEETALSAARARLQSEQVSTRDFECQLLAAGRVGPFTSRATVLLAGVDGIDCRAEVRDEGNGGRLIATANVRSAAWAD